MTFSREQERREAELEEVVRLGVKMREKQKAFYAAPKFSPDKQTLLAASKAAEKKFDAAAAVIVDRIEGRTLQL